jgi:site-specific recombinase XerD
MPNPTTAVKSLWSPFYFSTTHLIDNGIDIQFTKELLGHSRQKQANAIPMFLHKKLKK